MHLFLLLLNLTTVISITLCGFLIPDEPEIAQALALVALFTFITHRLAISLIVRHLKG
jgi:hypothetical protein